MARYMGSVQAQKFWEESIIKEETSRLSWFAKLNRGEANSPGKSKQYEVFRKKIENIPKPNEELLKRLPKIDIKKYHKKLPKSFDENLLKFTSNKDLLVEMRPVDKKVRTLLYDGFTKEERGRYQYLKARYRGDPENKYQYPLLSSWEYGWRLGDVIKKEDIKKPQFGRTRMVADTFYTRTGIPTLSTV